MDFKSLDEKQLNALKVAGIAVGAAALAGTAGLAVAGRKKGVGPLSNLYDWDKDVKKLVSAHPIDQHAQGIVVYGASEFGAWSTCVDDLDEFKVINHSLNFKKDKLLVSYLDTLVGAYEPEMVILQLQTPIYDNLKGKDEEKAEALFKKKKRVIEAIHEKLPDARVILVGEVLRPAYKDYVTASHLYNCKMAAYCEDTDYLYFVDPSDMTYNATGYDMDLFEKDGISLNEKGLQMLSEQYIHPEVESLVDFYGLKQLKRYAER